MCTGRPLLLKNKYKRKNINCNKIKKRLAIGFYSLYIQSAGFRLFDETPIHPEDLKYIVVTITVVW